jgi:uncharacterized membrane protein
MKKNHKKQAERGGFFSRIKSYFLTGIIVTAPVAITVYMSYCLLVWVNTSTSKLIPKQWTIGDFVPYAVPGLGLILLVVLLIFIGMFTTGYMGGFFVRLWEKIIRKMPIVSSIYSLFKQIFETFLSQKKNSFREVVLIEYPRKGIWTLAFVSQDQTGGEIEKKSKTKTLSVFVPTTPNPTSGFLLFIPRSDVIKLNMSVEDGIKYVISCGIVAPEKFETRRKK